MLDLSIDVAPDEFGSEARKGREVCKGWFNADCKHTSFRHGRCSIQFDQTPNGQMENAEQVPALPSWLSDLLPQHDRGIGGVGPPPPGTWSGQAPDRVAVAADPRPIADHLIHRFGQ